MTIAECILPGHPDKVCDRIADALVDAACARYRRALVGVEVAIHREYVLITGCIATNPPLAPSDVDRVVRQAFADAGYGSAWTPDPAKLVIQTDLRLEDLGPELRELRSISDDQAICVGWAGGRAEDRWLPRAHRLAWLACHHLANLRRGADLGPDGKVILAMNGDQIERASFSLHHRAGKDRTDLYRLAGKIGAAIGVGLDRIEVNGGGDFDVGGPWGDNGLSGKKLVVDAYGPGVPIGGGAWSGKDPHKVDRVGGLRARELALRAVKLGLGSEALVTLGWFPGDRAPSLVELAIDGTVVPIRVLGPADLSIDGTWRELRLGTVQFAPRAAAASWFQEAAPWEGACGVAMGEVELAGERRPRFPEAGL